MITFIKPVAPHIALKEIFEIQTCFQPLLSILLAIAGIFLPLSIPSLYHAILMLVMAWLFNLDTNPREHGAYHDACQVHRQRSD